MFKKSRLRTKLSLILIAVYVLSIINIFYPILRFESRILNLWYTMGFMCLPFLLFALGAGYAHWYSKIIATIVYGLISFFSGIVVVFILYGIAHMGIGEYDPSFYAIGSHQYEDARVVVYEIKGGAISSFGTNVRYEKKFISGLLYVKEIFVIREDVPIKVIFQQNHVVIDDQPYKMLSNDKFF